MKLGEGPSSNDNRGYIWPVQNPISENTNIVWNIPPLGKISDIGYPSFYKTSPTPSVQEIKTWSNLSIFWGYRSMVLNYAQTAWKV